MRTAGQKAVIEALIQAGSEVTRENYIAFNYGDEVPDPWTAEDEAELPEELQDWSIFDDDSDDDDA